MDRKTGGRRPDPRRAAVLAAVLILAAAAAAGFLLRPGRPAETGNGVSVFLDGKAWQAGDPLPEAGGELKVLVALDGAVLMELPFEEAHTVRVVQPDGGENTVTLTGEAVTMTEANCEGQDCVQMGEVTRENLEVRVMGGFIICLPHRLSVEVRSQR